MAQPHSQSGSRFALKALHTTLLALALLLGQLGLNAHAVDHSLNPDAPVCQLCVHAHSAGGTPPGATPAPDPAAVPRPALAPAPTGQVLGSPYCARAPPLCLLAAV